jgi:poly(3-hydroxybutyrate) depolymerase
MTQAKRRTIGDFSRPHHGIGNAALSWATPAYMAHELAHAAFGPARAISEATRYAYASNPLIPEPWRSAVAAGCELFERMTREYRQPKWHIDSTVVDEKQVSVSTSVVWQKTFCRLLHFERHFDGPAPEQPKLLIVAPLSGHYATLLRGTVEGFLPTHDVYITEWVDARTVPVLAGPFDMDDYIDYVIEMIDMLGPTTHLVAVCQPAVPVFAAVALLESRGAGTLPKSMILMGGPIDTRIHPTEVNKLAEERGIDWFRSHVITVVPFPHMGAMRPVYPGFLQLYGFMTMNLDRHMQEHWNLFQDLVNGDGDSAQKHRDFYDEYLAVMDLSAEYYLQTCETVFIEHALPKGTMKHRDKRVDPSAIRNVALMTVEGEHDDISGVGQTEAAHRLCPNLPDDRKRHWLQPGVGHYGVFNGSRFRSEIVPRISAFIREMES